MSSGGAAAWGSSNIGMNTANFAEYSSTMYGTSPGFHHDAPESSASQQEGSFRCEVEGCGKLFTRSYNYKAHLETHDERREYPFHCHVDGCDKKFARKTDLQRHHQSVHMKERNHGCTFCGRFFARKDTLRRLVTRVATHIVQHINNHELIDTWKTVAPRGLILRLLISISL